MSINEGLGTTINIRVMERCDWINLQRKKNTTSASRFKQDEIEMISNQCKIPERHNFFSCHAFVGSCGWQSMDSLSLSDLLISEEVVILTSPEKKKAVFLTEW